jgi:hypothetical protein
MKIALLVGILFLVFANCLAEKTITCENKIVRGQPGCKFSGVSIGLNETVSIQTNPKDLDVDTVEAIDFSDSHLFSVPPEVFTKFPNVRYFDAWGQKVREIRPDTFANAKKLEFIYLHSNKLTKLHPNTFQCKIFEFRA